MVRYDVIGCTYTQTRRADSRIAAAIRAALGDATSVVNVGAGEMELTAVSALVTGRGGDRRRILDPAGNANIRRPKRVCTG